MLADYDVSNYEDPVATFEEMAALRRHSDIPFSTHVPDLRRAVALGVPDIIVTNFAVLGGIGRATEVHRRLRGDGRRVLVLFGRYRRLHRGLSPCRAATPWITEASQSLFRWQIGDVIEGDPFRQVDNVVSVPEGPGLGVALDRAALKVWNRHFVEQRTVGPFPRSGLSGPASPHPAAL